MTLTPWAHHACNGSCSAAFSWAIVSWRRVTGQALRKPPPVLGQGYLWHSARAACCPTQAKAATLRPWAPRVPLPQTLCASSLNSSEEARPVHESASHASGSRRRSQALGSRAQQGEQPTKGQLRLKFQRKLKLKVPQVEESSETEQW